VLEPRTALAYWQNGKLYMHTGTQSAVQTVASIARWMRLDVKDVVLISEYTGGGFGSRATGAVICMIPALLSKKTGSPVMMRITREEDQYIGGIRPAVHGRVKAGFAKDGKLLAVDLYTVGENSAYEAQGDAASGSRFVSLLYQPVAMRSRSVTVLTNTPPRRAQSQPGGLQAIMIFEPVVSKAARKLGIDQVAIRHMNAPAGKARFGPANPKGERGYATSAFIKEALDRGKVVFGWDERKARSGKDKRVGSKVRGVGVAVSSFVAGSTGFDGLFVIKPDGRMYIQSGVGNLGTESFSDVHRVAAEMMGVPWERVEVAWGDTSRNLPWTCVSGGSQTTHAMTRAAHAAASDAIKKAKEIAAKTMGGSADSYRVADGRVSSGGRSMTLAEVARKAVELGGAYDGHALPDNINKVTATAATALAGQGLMGVARDTYPRDGTSFSFVAGFAEVEVDVETGAYRVVDYTAIGDSGTIIHPRAYLGQLLGRSVLGMGHALAQKTVYDQHYGLALATRMYQSRPPTILDVPRNMKGEALNIPDPETPVGARGIGEPPVAAGACAILNALSDALGDDIYRRAPVTLDTILMALEHGRPMQEPLTAHI
jgi:CO/xanthine dehydrogenase Mo-binding subunit